MVSIRVSLISGAGHLFMDLRMVHLPSFKPFARFLTRIVVVEVYLLAMVAEAKGETDREDEPFAG